MLKKQASEEGFQTEIIYDTKNTEFEKDDIYYSINKLEVYYTSESIIGFFPLYEKREMNKKIEQNSFYFEFQKNLPEIEQKLKNQKLELKKEVTTLNDFIQNIKIIYDTHKQQIQALKIDCNDKINIYGNFSLFNKKDYVLLKKANYFITGLKTTYIKSKDGIPYLSFIKCYFGEYNDYDLYYYHNDGKNCCSHFIDRVFNFMKLPFILFDKCFCLFLRFLLILLKIFLVLSLILGLPIYWYWKSQNIFTGNFIISESNSEYKINNNDEIKIYTDENGFSHIKANNREDAYFGLGFEHAKNRLFQIDMNRRIARGTLSEIFGKRTIETDKLMRRMGYNQYSIKNEKYLKENSIFIKEVNAYIAGINYFANNFKLPLEYYITGAKFHNFTLVDSIAMFSMFSFAMSNDYDIEILYQHLEREMGKEFTEKVFSYRDTGFPFWNQTIVNDVELKDINLMNKRSQAYHQSNKNVEKEAKSNDIKIESNQGSKDEDSKKGKIDDSFFGNKLNNPGASNCFNIEGRFTKSGKPLLVNDPHLACTQPNIIFIAKIYLPDMVISGGTLSGTPVFTTGSNGYISWGATTENSDNTDFCEEIIQGDYYIKDNKNYPLTIVKEVIKVKDSDPIIYEVKYTDNGPILGKTIPGSFSLFKTDFENNLPLSSRMGFMKHDFASDFYFRLNLAKSPDDFLPFKHQGTISNYNLHWISRDGQIGYFTLGIIFLKKYNNRFCHGYSSKDDVINEIPQNEMLYLTSPKKGYIVSANNKPVSNNYLYKLMGNYNNARAYRVDELINQFIKNNTKISINDSINIIKDVKNSIAEYILPKFLEIIRRNLSPKELNENTYYLLLKNWNFEFDMNSRGATLYSLLERNLLLSLVSKKLSDDKAKPLLNYFISYNFLHGIIEKIYNKEKVTMKECTLNTNNNDCEKHFLYVFTHLENYIKDFCDFSGIPKKWGDVNFNYFSHTPFDDIPILKYFYSSKKYVSGNKDTVKISRSYGNDKNGDFVGTQTPKIQFICDMADPQQPYLLLQGGNGGSPLQKYYNNLKDRIETKDFIHFTNIDFNDEKYKNRIITLGKKK